MNDRSDAIKKAVIDVIQSSEEDQESKELLKLFNVHLNTE